MARVYTKIGDVFSVKLDGTHKKYFQLVAYDQGQLNSDVIRAFERSYPITATPELSEVLKGEVAFYAHCVTKAGVKLGLWEKVGSSEDVGSLKDVLFRDTNDYGGKPGEQVAVSHRWYVWKVNEEFEHVGKLHGKYRQAHVGIVINPHGIIELMKSNKYPPFYPE